MTRKNQILDKMVRTVMIRFQKQNSDSSNDDVVYISHSVNNHALYDVTMKHFNAHNSNYKGLLSYNDMMRYVENLMWVACSDEDTSYTCISHIQYDIPGFPSIVVERDSFAYDEDQYDTFYSALKFWANTL
jgi:hypothetical protein